MKIQIMKKENVPKPSKIIQKETSALTDGTKIGCTNIRMSKPAVHSVYKKGFAKLKHTTYYSLFRGWVLAITK